MGFMQGDMKAMTKGDQKGGCSMTKNNEQNMDHNHHQEHHHEHHRHNDNQSNYHGHNDTHEKHDRHMEHHHSPNHHDHGGKDHHDHGHGGHHDHGEMIADFKKRFYISLILTIPILALSPMIQMFMGVDWSFSGDLYILFALSTVIFFYGGWPFITGAVSELKNKNPGMMTLIGLAITIAYGYSMMVVFGWEGDQLF